jgi:omega-6 fatty acid desaturase / acyl-lipid omega-6 desaturase (Delta-12 desaturase)
MTATDLISPHVKPIERQPTAKPTFTIATLRAAIPKHCFNRSLPRSLSYLFTDLVMVAALYWASTHIDTAPVPTSIRWLVLWPAYWFFQGTVCTGIWVLAHECGHQAFSAHQSINDGLGLLLHSALLVPYYSWKHSHRRHHSNTANVAKDEVFVPDQRDEVTEGFEWDQLPLARFYSLARSLILGWPLYLLLNVASRPYPGHTWVNHFSPWSPIFSKRERVEVGISDAALVVVLAGLGAAGRAFGVGWLVKTYAVPLLVVNFWLVMITLMQHSHPGRG